MSADVAGSRQTWGKFARAAKPSGSLVGASAAWVNGHPWGAVVLLLAVNVAIPFFSLFIQYVALPGARGAGRALEPGIQCSLDLFFERRHIKAEAKIAAARSAAVIPQIQPDGLADCPHAGSEVALSELMGEGHQPQSRVAGGVSG